jgi:hypothetical protein
VDALLEQYCNAARALHAALAALQDASPNARDYYVQAGDAFSAASREHAERVRKIRGMLSEVAQLVEAVDDQRAARAKGHS